MAQRQTAEWTETSNGDTPNADQKAKGLNSETALVIIGATVGVIVGLLLLSGFKRMVTDQDGRDTLEELRLSDAR